MLQSALREYEISKYSEYDKNFIQQIDRAEIPLVKSGPKKLKITLIVMVATEIALLLLFAFKMLLESNFFLCNLFLCLI